MLSKQDVDRFTERSPLGYTGERQNLANQRVAVTMRDAVRNKETQEGRRTPTHDPSAVGVRRTSVSCMQIEGT